MTAKMSAARRAGFLRALGRTGNYAVAAEQAGVSRGWVLKVRRAEPDFDALCRETVAAVDARLRAAGAGARGRSWGHLDGVQLAVRGTGGSGGARRVQIGRARVHQWGPRTEDRFLAVLAATCNVKAAYEAVGMSKGSAYTHRRRWPAFAQRWDDAIEMGAVRLELALVHTAANLFSGKGLPEPAPMPAMTTDDILHNLYMHQYRLYGRGKAPGLEPRPMSLEESCAAILRQVERIERGEGVSEAEMKALAAEHARRGAAGGG
jgi:hypothetical protein